jgi:ELWxxDGT repeat protein
LIHRIARLALLGLAPLAFPDLTAQVPALVRDLNTTPLANGSSYPGGYARLANGTVLFGADSIDANKVRRGHELFRTLGIPGTTSFLKEIRPGFIGSRPRRMVSMGTYAIFTANDSTGRGLYRSDGTAIGTTLIKRIVADPVQPTVFKGKLYFFLPSDLWVSDGTAAGTNRVKSFSFGFSSLRAMTVMGNTLYLSGSSSTTGVELFKSDGTATGTVLVKDIVSGTPGSEIGNLVTHGTKIFFTATTPTQGRELWMSNGSAGGTKIVKDVNPGTGHGILTARPHQIIPVVITPAFKYVYFMAYTTTAGLELWRTDGTTLGTFLVKDVVPGTGEGMPEKMIPFGTSLLFGSRTSKSFALFKTDGTTAGTVMIRSLARMPDSLVDGGTKAYMSVFDPTFGRELFVTDGFATGTKLLKDIRPGIANADPSTLGLAPGGRFLFSAVDAVRGRELWVTDGTAAQTKLLADIVAPPPGSTESSNAWPIVRGDGRTWVAARGGNGLGLWRTDGTTAGTVLVSSIAVGGGDYPHMMPIGSGLFFNAKDATGTELWFSDGTSAGTRRVADIRVGSLSSYPRDGVVLDGRRVLFSADNGTHGRELWVSDGTALGTKMVKDIRASGSASPQSLTRLGNDVLFTAWDGGSGTTLWKSDGTAGGTVLLARFTRTPTKLQRVGHEVFIHEQRIPSKIWKTDGTAANTKVVFSLPRLFIDVEMVPVDDKLYVLTDRQLWVTDGKAGTVVRDLTTASTRQQFGRNLTAAGSRLFFTASAGTNSWPVLWKSDGTRAGTVPVTMSGGGYVFAGGRSSLRGSRSIVPAGTRKVYFAGTTTSSGPTELWVSDGSTSGTKQVHDIWPGSPSSKLTFLTHTDGRVLFIAGDGVKGRELWGHDVGANAQVSGLGCAGSGKPPGLAANDPVLGGPLTFRVARAPANASGVLGVGFPAVLGGPLFANGCSVPVDYGLPHFLFFFTASASGAWQSTLPVPKDTNLIGLQLASQTGVSAAMTGPFGLDLSNTLYLMLGK